MEKTKDVIITESLDGLGTDAFGDYLAHAICLGGSCSFVFNAKDFELRSRFYMRPHHSLSYALR